MSKVEYARQPEGTWRIAHMTEHDLHEVVEIEESCGLSCWGWEAYHDELVNGHASLMLVARYHPAQIHADEKHLAGFVASRLIADELHINNIAVRPDSRRQGIGDALLSGVLRAGAQVGARSALLEVRASNQSAQALYAGHGFRIAGRRSGYYSAPPEDALVMRASVGS